MEREIARHEAVDDDGNLYTIIEYQEFKQSRPLSGPATWVKRLKRLELTDGSEVNFVDDQTFKLVRTDKIVRKTS